MKKIGILYICTGPYILFWEDFYKSFENKFIKDYEKHYFVFTNSNDIYNSQNERVHLYSIENQPWPLVTLLRFQTFLSAEKDIEKCDYLLFSNANIVCEKEILSDEILPREDKGENIFVTTHPGYYQKPRVFFPYERSQRSLAYIPWNLGKTYVIGAFFGGTSKAFIELCKTLKKNIEEDLKKNVIARWHDESHLNRYIIGKDSVRILSPEYCYPVGLKVSYSKKISSVSKQVKFDVKTFKGYYAKEMTISQKLRNKFDSLHLSGWLKYFRDSIINKKV
jgi:hypothetical protein